jgi:hypothetical protein
MGIIESKVRDVFENYEKDGDIYNLAIEMAHIGDYSIRSMQNWYVLTSAVNKIKKEKLEETIEYLAKMTEEGPDFTF